MVATYCHKLCKYRSLCLPKDIEAEACNKGFVHFTKFPTDAQSFTESEAFTGLAIYFYLCGL